MRVFYVNLKWIGMLEWKILGVLGGEMDFIVVWAQIYCFLLGR
jgi:hypothetical protein